MTKSSGIRITCMTCGKKYRSNKSGTKLCPHCTPYNTGPHAQRRKIEKRNRRYGC